MQVLSLAVPGCEQFDTADGLAMARETNDELAEWVKKYPDRYIGLAALAPQDPEAAARELERCVKELGFRGAKLNSHCRGEYLDNEKFWPIFAKAEELDVPVYLHPTIPSPLLLQGYADYGFPWPDRPWDSAKIHACTLCV
jgi:2,3-dihydroxybenzoate decarboxylase